MPAVVAVAMAITVMAIPVTMRTAMMVMPVSNEVQQARLVGSLCAGLRRRWQRGGCADSGKGDSGSQ